MSIQSDNSEKNDERDANPILEVLASIWDKRFPRFPVVAMAVFMEREFRSALKELTQNKELPDVTVEQVRQWLRGNCHDEKFDACLEMLQCNGKSKTAEDFRNVLEKFRGNTSIIYPKAVRDAVSDIEKRFKMILTEDNDKCEATEDLIRKRTGDNELLVVFKESDSRLRWRKLSISSGVCGPELKSSSTVQESPARPFVLNLLEDEKWIHLDGETEAKKTRVITSNSSPLSKISYSYNAKRFGGATGYHDFEIVSVSCEDPHYPDRVSIKLTENNPSSVFYDVLFDPPLSFGESLRFTVSEKFRGLFHPSLEEMQRLRSEDKLFFDSNELRSATRATSALQILHRRITFDPGYSVKARLGVRFQDSPFHEEVSRLYNSNAFTVSECDGRQVLELHVDNPIDGATYEFWWFPPSERDLP